MAEYEIGKLYPLTPPMVDSITRQMGLGAMMMSGKPDLSRGRRYEGASPDRWAFWTTEKQRIDVSIDRFNSFICNFGNGADPDCPEPQFQAVANVAESLAKLTELLTRPRNKKCIKPDCENLVAPIGTKKPEPGVFKNYAATGACQKGHNGYYCEQCQRPHSYASDIGKRHLPAEPERLSETVTDLIADIGFPQTAEALRLRQ